MSSFVVQPEAPKPGEALPDVENNPDIEKQWVVKACQYCETYDKLISSIKDYTKLRLTAMDDEIYVAFRSTFPDMKVDVLNEDEIKSKEGKEKWRPLLMSFDKRLNSYNFLTMMKADMKGGWDEANTMLVPRIQFFCIELARLREGFYTQLQKQQQS